MVHPSASKRPRTRSPVVLSHSSSYVCAPPSHSASAGAAVAGHYGIPMAAVAGYDTVFHGQPFMQVSHLWSSWPYFYNLLSSLDKFWECQDVRDNKVSENIHDIFDTGCVEKGLIQFSISYF
jgi:hypothetical protein